MFKYIFLIFIFIFTNFNVYSKSPDENLINIRVTPSRIDKGIIGANTKIITQKDINKKSYSDLNDILSRESGIQLESLYGGIDGAKSSVKLRGFGEYASRNVLFLLNGRRFTDITLGKVNLARIPINTIKRIEIIKGGVASTLFGDGASGGAVNIITDAKFFFKNKVDVIAGSGSLNSNKQSVIFDQNYKDLYLNGYFISSKSDGYRDNNEYDFKNEKFSVTKIFDLYNLFTIEVETANQKVRLPGGLSLTDYYLNPKKTNKPTEYANENIRNIGLTFEKKINSNHFFKSDLYLEDKKQQTFQALFGNDYMINYGINSYNLKNELQIPYKLLNKRIVSKLGLDINKAFYKKKQIIPSTYFNTVNQLILEPWISSNLVFNKTLKFNLGYRFHNYKLNVYDKTNERNKLLDKNQTSNAWSIGVTNRINNNSSIFGNLSNSYRAPRVDEIVNTSATPTVNHILHQRSEELELGLKQNFKTLDSKLSIFRKNIKNQIYMNPSTFKNENYDPSTHEGIDFEVNKKFFEDKIKVSFNFSLNDSYFSEGNFKNKKVPNVAKFTSNGQVEYNLDPDLKIYLDHKYVGNKFELGDEANTKSKKAKSYSIFNLGINGIYNGFDTKLNITNVFNKKYYDFKTYGQVYPLPGRGVMLTLKKEF